MRRSVISIGRPGGLIAEISLCLTAFGPGYAIGSKDNNKTQKSNSAAYSPLKSFYNGFCTKARNIDSKVQAKVQVDMMCLAKRKFVEWVKKQMRS